MYLKLSPWRFNEGKYCSDVDNRTIKCYWWYKKNTKLSFVVCCMPETCVEHIMRINALYQTMLKQIKIYHIHGKIYESLSERAFKTIFNLNMAHCFISQYHGTQQEYKWCMNDKKIFCVTSLRCIVQKKGSGFSRQSTFKCLPCEISQTQSCSTSQQGISICKQSKTT